MSAHWSTYSGCYIGCFYYSDSCFRKDCFTHDDEVDVYFNINNDMFYWIDPKTNKVMCATEKMEHIDISWRSLKDFLEDIDPTNPDACLVKV